MFKQCALFLFLALAIARPAAAEENVCDDSANLFCSSVGGYLAFENGEYVIYPGRDEASTTWEYLYVTTAENVHTRNPVIPPNVYKPMKDMVSENVLDGIFYYCVLVPNSVMPGTPGFKTLAIMKQGRPMPVQLCGGRDMKQRRRLVVEKGILAHRKSAQARAAAAAAAGTKKKAKAPEIIVTKHR